MPILGPEHDLQHPVEGDSAWSESYYFNGYDPDEDIGFYSRVGIRPNEGYMDLGMSLWLPGQEVGHMGGRREQKTMIDRMLDVGDMKYELIEPMKRWRIAGAGQARVSALETRATRQAEISMDVEFHALMPAIGTDGQGKEGSGPSAETRKSVGKGHLEQGGRWTGEISIDGVTHTLGPNARGNRDKSWGPRRWGGPKMWRWFSINIDDNTHFGGIRIGTDAGDLHRGWIWKNEAHASIKEWRVKTELEADGVTQKVCHVIAVEKNGVEHALRADLLRVAPGGGTKNGTVVNEGLARWTYEGVTGTGIAEYLHQFDSEGRTRVPIE